jgi:hypothetical protein
MLEICPHFERANPKNEANFNIHDLRHELRNFSRINPQKTPRAKKEHWCDEGLFLDTNCTNFNIGFHFLADKTSCFCYSECMAINFPGHLFRLGSDTFENLNS